MNGRRDSPLLIVVSRGLRLPIRREEALPELARVIHPAHRAEAELVRRCDCEGTIEPRVVEEEPTGPHWSCPEEGIVVVELRGTVGARHAGALLGMTNSVSAKSCPMAT